jgi:Zn-dependent metalloprotease
MHPLFKRSGCLLLAAAMLTPASLAFAEPSPASAPVSALANLLPVDGNQVKLSKEQALNIAKRLIPADGLELTGTSLRSAEPWRPFPEWSFHWVKKGKTEGTVDVSYNVGIHADTGELTAFSYYEQQPNLPSYKAKLSYEEAQKLAERFLAQYAPGKAGQTRLYKRDVPPQKTPLGNNVYYNFRFVRTVDGVLLPENSIDIVVNGAGAVTNYSLNWNDKINLDKPKQTISKEQAEAIFLKDTKAQLSYFIPWQRQGQENEQPYLGYRNPFDFYLDAASGEPLSQALVPLGTTKDPVRVSDKKLPPIHSGKTLSEAEALKLAHKLFDLSGYQLRGSNYHEQDYRGNRSVWNLEFVAKEADRQGYLFLSLDAQTGDVYTFTKEKGYPLSKENGNQKMKDEKLQEMAMESVRKWTPTFADQLYLLDSRGNDPYQEQIPRKSFQFQRFVNGVAAATGTAYITFDTATGELISYNFDYGKESYPSEVPKHRSAEEAIQAWLKEAEVEPVYILTPINPEEAAKIKTGERVTLSARTAKLVYRVSVTPFEHPYFFDAVTGEWRSQETGKAIALHRPAPADIAGHRAEKELLLMYEYDALSLIDGKIVPERPITRGEMIEMLMISLHHGRFYPQYSLERKASFSDVASGSRYFAAVEAAVDRGLLDKNSSTLKPDEPITREELADMLVRALGYRKLAEYSGMFQTKLTDIGDSKQRGAIVIVTTLGIMDADRTEFQPKEQVSRADAAIAFFRFLEKRSELDGNAGIGPRPYEY